MSSSSSSSFVTSSSSSSSKKEEKKEKPNEKTNMNQKKGLTTLDKSQVYIFFTDFPEPLYIYDFEKEVRPIGMEGIQRELHHAKTVGFFDVSNGFTLIYDGNEEGKRMPYNDGINKLFARDLAKFKLKGAIAVISTANLKKLEGPPQVDEEEEEEEDEADDDDQFEDDEFEDDQDEDDEEDEKEKEKQKKASGKKENSGKQEKKT
jgi:hypothetical protein